MVGAEQTGQAWGDITVWGDTGPHLMEVLGLNTQLWPYKCYYLHYLYSAYFYKIIISCFAKWVTEPQNDGSNI